ncbi:MAG: CPBP family intramembrane metalloprotease, partial [Clostridia bacterium]|nr:CPBP family intramembrane metalloprotease [Clostridia bacterium]
LLKIILVEMIAYMMMMPLEAVLGESSLIYLVASELLSKGLVLWMVIRFYREETNPLTLSELLGDAYGGETPVVVQPEPKIRSRKIFLGIIILVIVGFRLLYDNSVAYVLTQYVEVSEELVEAFDDLFTWPIYALFSVVVLAPFYEELLFRKFMLGGMLKRLNAFWAIVISAFFFAFVHLNMLQGVNAFVLGLIVGWLYYRTESVVLCMFAHFVNNLYAVTLGILQEAFLTEPVLWANSLLCVLGGILLIVSKEKIERLLI